VCLSGVVLVFLAKNGLGDRAGMLALGCFLGAILTARVCAGAASPASVN